MQIDELLMVLPARVLHGVVGPLCRRCDLRLLLLLLVVGVIGAVIAVAVVFGPDAIGGAGGEGAAERVWP